MQNRETLRLLADQKHLSEWETIRAKFFAPSLLERYLVDAAREGKYTITIVLGEISPLSVRMAIATVMHEVRDVNASIEYDEEQGHVMTIIWT